MNKKTPTKNKLPVKPCGDTIVSKKINAEDDDFVANLPDTIQTRPERGKYSDRIEKMIQASWKLSVLAPSLYPS